ncbi:MAG: diacylglycerol/lipid kinase family protein [Egibacteraceae bacterium]
MSIVLVTNTEAGTADADAVEAARAELARGADVEVVRTHSADDLDRLFHVLDGRMLVLAGGDGSVHLAVGRLLRQDPALLAETTIGLVPLGTGNDLARGLGIPTDPAEAAELCVRGTPRRLDLIVTDHGGVVVNTAHAGLGAAASERAAPMKASLGPLAYPFGAIIAGVREGAWDLEITVDGRLTHTGPTLMVGIGNAPYVGGGTCLLPRAVPDDGLLDVVVVTAVSPAARIAFGAALYRGTHLDQADVISKRGRSVMIAGDEVTHVLDGELVHDLASCTYTIRPEAWRIVAP